MASREERVLRAGKDAHAASPQLSHVKGEGIEFAKVLERKREMKDAPPFSRPLIGCITWSKSSHSK
jgi:hypothetical protein